MVNTPNELGERLRKKRTPLEQIAMASAAAMVVSIFAPWATVSVNILGAAGGGLNFKGTDIGSDIGNIPWAWFLGAAGAVGLVALFRETPRIAALAGVAGAVFAIVTLTTLDAGSITATANGVQIGRALDLKVDPAYGVGVAIAAAVSLAVCAALLARR